MDALRSVEALIKARPFLSAAGALVVGVGLVAYHDYRSYVSMGPHGLPDTFWGWRRQLQMSRRARKDTTAPAPYDLDSVAGPNDRTSYLSRPPAQGGVMLGRRRGDEGAPRVPGFVAPQRQTTQLASGATKRAMHAYVDALVAANPGVLETSLSVLEGPVPAMRVAADTAGGARGRGRGGGGGGVLARTRGEMLHIHPPDGSTHLVVSLADQRRVIELGWGRRHRLSGGGLLPWNYTLVYAPRDDDELAAWRAIVVAAARFCCAGVADIRKPLSG